MTTILNEKTSRTEGFPYRKPDQIRGARYAVAADWNNAVAWFGNVQAEKADFVESVDLVINRHRRDNSPEFRQLVEFFSMGLRERGYWEDPVDEAWFLRTCRHGYPGGRTFQTIDRKAWTPDTN